MTRLLHPSVVRVTLALIACWMCALAQANVKLEITGIEDSSVEEQLRVYLGTPVSAEQSDIHAFLKTIDEESLKALQAVGYYGSSVAAKVIGKGEESEILLEVELGEPVRVAGLQFVLDGEARDDPVFQRLLKAPGIAKGDIFNHGAYESFKSAFTGLARARGYFDARYLEHRVEVKPKRYRANILLHFDSGPRYQLGAVTFQGAPVADDYLQRWLTFAPGTPYESRLLAELTKSLLDSGYFKAVRHELQYAAVQGRQIPLEIEVTPNPPNSIGLGTGFATDTGPRGRITWSKPYVNTRGHSFQSEIAISGINQSLSAQYKIPYRDEPQTHYMLYEAGVRNEKLDDSESRLSTASMQHHRRTSNDWHEVRSLRWEQERFELKGQDQERTTLYLPGISWSKSVQEAPLRPQWGYRYTLFTQAAARGLASDIDLLKIIVSGKWLWRFRERHHLLGRMELGALGSDNFDRVPRSHRFFAGGDQSIRGFKFQSVEPGDGVGGHYLTVGSLEYIWRFAGYWGLAAFVDAGRAYSSASERTRVGAGFGLRWHSPVGPLRIDLGFGVSEEDVPVRLHLSIGPEL